MQNSNNGTKLKFAMRKISFLLFQLLLFCYVKNS